MYFGQTDMFGARNGTIVNRVNDILLSSEGTPIREKIILETLGEKGPVTYYLDKLVRLGLLRWDRPTNSYCLVSNWREVVDSYKGGSNNLAA